MINLLHWLTIDKRNQTTSNNLSTTFSCEKMKSQSGSKCLNGRDAARVKRSEHQRLKTETETVDAWFFLE